MLKTQFFKRPQLKLLIVAALIGAVAVVAYGDVLDGTNKADVLTDPSTSDSVIYGLAGDDTIRLDEPTAAGTDMDNDTAFAGPGDDSIFTGDNDDDATIFGGDGHDIFHLRPETFGGPTYTVNGDRGNDFFDLTDSGDLIINNNSILVDGPGQDTFLDTTDGPEYTIRLVADNAKDTVRVTAPGTNLTIELSEGSGPDVIQCDDESPGTGGTVFLNGNRKAVDPKGNNLREAALLGGTAESGCDQIIP